MSELAVQAEPTPAPEAEAAPVSRAEQVEAAWTKANEEGAAEKAEPEVTAKSLEEKPERQSVSGSIREFIRSHQPKVAEPTGLEAEVQQLQFAHLVQCRPSAYLVWNAEFLELVRIQAQVPSPVGDDHEIVGGHP